MEHKVPTYRSHGDPTHNSSLARNKAADSRADPQTGFWITVNGQPARIDATVASVKVYNFTGYAIILLYALACLATAPPHLGPWGGLAIGAT
jgi:hypothetical protein